MDDAKLWMLDRPRLNDIQYTKVHNYNGKYRYVYFYEHK